VVCLGFSFGCIIAIRSFSPQLYRALKPPGWHKEWHIGVRVSSNRKLVAFISGVPIRLQVRQKWASCTIYASPLLICLQRAGCSRDKLSLCAQKITLQASRTGTYQGSYPAVSPQGHLSSHLHCRNRDPHADLHVQVLPSHIECAQARRRQIHVRAPRHDHRPNDPAIQSSFDSLSRAFWPQGDGGEGCVGRRRVVPEVHGALRHDPNA
jgi:hypothetical protein